MHGEAAGHDVHGHAAGDDIHGHAAGHHAHGDSASHDTHAGHSVEMFRRKFWGTFLLSIPTVLWAPMIEHWFGYEAPGGAAASRWIPRPARISRRRS